MSNGSNSSRIGIVLASLITGLALVLCAVTVSSTLVKIKGFGQSIAVTGAAYKPIKSDYAIWKGQISTTAATLDAAYAQMKKSLQKTEDFLKLQNYTKNIYDVGTVHINKNIDYRTQTLVGYTLNQSITVELADVARITDLAKKASTLIEEGVEISSSSPQYLFTGLESLKIEMIKAATENAKLRAQQLAETTGRSIGAPTSARVGVFQIRPMHSQDVSSMGMSDVTSVDKEIVSTVHVSFLID